MVKPQTNILAPNLIKNDNNSTNSDHNNNAKQSLVYQKKKVDDDQNHVVRLASQISNNDLDWILTLESENGIWDLYRKHPNRNKDGSYDYSCGLNSYYHKDMISKIKAKTVNETEILNYCYKVYNERKTAFYGYKKRLSNISKFYLTQI